MSDFEPILRPSRKAVISAVSLGLRTHIALVNVIVSAFEVLPELRKDEAAFINFAKQQHGLTVKGKAVDDFVLLVVKVLFLNVSDKTDFRRRLGQIATAIRYMELHQDMFSVECVKRLVHDLGGVSGLVMAFRNESRTSRNPNREEKKVRTIQTYVAGLPQIGTTVQLGDGEVTTINTPKDNRTLEALAQKPGRVLIVGDVDDEFNLVNLRVIERDQDEIDRLLTRKAAQVTKTGSNDNQPMKEAM
ncbi:hypothetical protein A6A04_19995 [Paramagnetospirillum marisnigri]|uniref:Uncharacterized protein n=1 Tax=Paramagnetospirillum marisnigri TaxID=1285242 RepID=A0A178MJC7_9PROT|nr:hypothetical protein [Paramagnetospirillum marisnigri]OAN48663.1 hypothetical protein A6A04_19995 [Paramagnetospirillum marisnigri]